MVAQADGGVNWFDGAVTGVSAHGDACDIHYDDGDEALIVLHPFQHPKV